jgi:ribosome-binding protein aMBF1 (putative translation factor)
LAISAAGSEVPTVRPAVAILIVCRLRGIISPRFGADSCNTGAPMGRKELRKASEDLTNILAENLRAFRKSKGLSQEELADMCDLHRTYVGSVERGERNVTLSTLETLAAALGVSVPELLTKRASDDGD